METIILNGIKYYKENPEFICNEISNAGVAGSMNEKNVIVRTRNEGINCGTVVSADETGVILKDVRRIWYHKPKDTKLFWYEGVAMSGLSEDSKVSGTVPLKVIVEDYSMTIITDAAYKSIMEKKVG